MFQEVFFFLVVWSFIFFITNIGHMQCNGQDGFLELLHVFSYDPINVILNVCVISH